VLYGVANYHGSWSDTLRSGMFADPRRLVELMKPSNTLHRFMILLIIYNHRLV
jgi:hypothetical protein